jgi:hypothetical protein
VKTFDVSDPASMDLKGLAESMKHMSDEEIADLLGADVQMVVVDEVFRRMPRFYQPARAGGKTEVVHFAVTERAGGPGRVYEMVLKPDACVTSADPSGEPDLMLTLDAIDFLKIVSNSANPVTLFMNGKLKASGDLGIAANFSSLFEPPKN